MVFCAKELAATELKHVPLLVGGATTSKRHAAVTPFPEEPSDHALAGLKAGESIFEYVLADSFDAKIVFIGN